MSLPVSRRLPLADAVDRVAKECDVTVERARDAVAAACADGSLTASGSTPLSAHRDLAKRFEAKAWKSESIDAAIWSAAIASGDIDWADGRVQFYRTIDFDRGQFHSWLRPHTEDQNPGVETEQGPRPVSGLEVAEIGAPPDPVRPEGVSDAAWKTYRLACKLMPRFWEKRGGISKVSRRVATNSETVHDKSQTVRRAITEVRKALRSSNALT